MMYRLMVVEDEERIRKGIVQAIDWASMGFIVVGEAINGRDAMRKFPECNPDVILTDVRMPVMDGLELVRQIKMENSRIHFVILSGFSDFDTVRSALKSQVDDYLLKPTDKKSLVQTFTQLRETLDREAEARRQAEQQQMLLNEGLRVLRQEFMLSLVHGTLKDAALIEDRLNLLEIGLDGDSHAVVIFRASDAGDTGDAGDVGDAGDNKTSPLDSQASFTDSAGLWLRDQADAVNQIAQLQERGFAFQGQDNQLILVLSGAHEQHNDAGIRKDVLQIMQQLQAQDPRWNSVIAGIGHIYPNLIQMDCSYAEAMRALTRHFFNADPSAGKVYQEFDSSIQEWLNEYPYEISEIVAKVFAGQADAVSQMIDQLFSSLRNRNQDPSFVKDYCHSMAFLLKSNIAGIGTISDKADFAGFEQTIRGAHTFDELQRQVRDRFVLVASFIGAMKEDKKSNSNRIIETLKAYIDENYSRDLSLEELSKHVYLTPVYISFLFKSVTGENYMSYLRKVRLLKARELLLKDNFKVYEISHMVGYGDYKYFTSQFKKMFGISPTEFRDKIHANGEG